MTALDFEKYAVAGAHAHLVGVGGVSMSPLAEILHGMGIKVTGSDISESKTIERLRSLGIDVKIGHRAENIEGADFIVRTAAVHDDNPEITAARNAGIPVFERTQAWGSMMRNYKNALCISGTHGKTTTTSMATHILTAAGQDPTVMIGGTLPLLGSGYRVGGGDTIIMESCEYYNSFLSFFPTISVILNIDADHLDYFKSIEDIKQSFRKFACLVPPDGCIVANADDKNTMEAISGLDRNIITFGFSENADVRAVNVKSEGIGSIFDVLYKGELYAHISMKVPGHHNITNALAATAAAIFLKLPAEPVEKGLYSFTGAGRRFEYKGEYKGAKVYDDYAHHPSELKALLSAAKSLGFKRLIVAFQPHTYSRTKALFDDFVRELARADKVFLAEIYAAREDNEVGIYSRDLAEKIEGAEVCENFEELTKRLRETASDGDIILTVGAGDIYKVGEALVEK
ncbi:MAG TPA: UDP-N-acetylmuramate--L-alanine ligase [Clostridiales bacterium]|jgi:UDP-N-acetylmuramate--alanine ligase|nr:UDP-N-acetylmuramate--L-alanine ligase [Clostridiales bacterium]